MFDEQLYLIAYNDFAGKAIDEALWIKAMTLSKGDKQRAKWHYIELRVDQMLRDPSLRKSVQRKINPSSTSGAYMIWISFIIVLGLIGIATSFDFMNLEFNLINLTYFVDIPSLLIIWLPSIVFSISATSWKSYWHSWSYPFLWRKQVSEDDANSAVRCLKVKGDAGFIMGILGTIIGAIIIIRDITTFIETQDLLNAVSVASITIFYGLLYKLLCYIAEQRVRNLYLN
jgi:hypothetical protein